MNEFTEERIVDSGVETKETEGAPSADNRRSRLLSADNMLQPAVVRPGSARPAEGSQYSEDGFAEDEVLAAAPLGYRFLSRANILIRPGLF